MGLTALPTLISSMFISSLASCLKLLSLLPVTYADA
jgi:hypothetical protein